MKQDKVVPPKEVVEYMEKCTDNFTVGDWDRMSIEEQKSYLPQEVKSL